MDMLVSGVGGIASRTPVDFGSVVFENARRSLPEYEPIKLEHSPHYLLFGFHRQVAFDRFMFVVIIADKTSGKVAAEVGLNIRNKIPYYRLAVPVQLGTFGFRERVDLLLGTRDYSYVYRSKDDLQRTLQEIFNLYVTHAQRALLEKMEINIEKSKSTWMPLYEEWQIADQASESTMDGELRYPDLANEAEIRQFIQKKLSEPLTMRYLGGLRSSYKDVNFFNAQVYLMARGLEFLGDGSDALTLPGSIAGSEAEAAPANAEQRITWADIMGANPEKEAAASEQKRPKNTAEPLDDVTLFLTGRLPQQKCISFSEDRDERCMEFAFYKTLSVLEGLYRPQSKGGFFEFSK